jgi:LysB family phage lysis regulatory protein
MSLSALRPILLALLLIAAGAGLVWWGLAPRIDLQAARADRAEQARDEVQQLIDLQAGVLAEQQRQIGAVTDLEQQLRALNQSVTRNAAQQRAALEELIRHDQATVDYLAAAVPAALGRLYQRPETTDPAAYRRPGAVPDDPVPPAGAVADGSQ